MPSNDGTYMRDYMRQYRASNREKVNKYQRKYNGKRSAAKQLEREFVGFDGEGITLDNGYHAYVMLRIGEDVIFPRNGAQRLTTAECLDFIASRDPSNIYVGYFLGYDFTKILEDLPFAKMQRLLNRGVRTMPNGQLFPIDYMDFQIEYLPGKELKVRKKKPNGDVTSWVTINDVGSFFQCPFLKAIIDWKVGTKEEQEIIKRGKDMRSAFTFKDLKDMDSYNALEIRLLQWLMSLFRDACADAGYLPKRWQGPGQLAEAMFRAHDVPASKDVPLLQDEKYASLLFFAQASFYGGHSEIAMVGPICVPVWQYDINSAYPHVMRLLPCLIHGEWTLVEKNADVYSMDCPTGQLGERFSLVYGSFKERANDPGSLWYGLPMRTQNGTIVFPQRGSGWYWSFEIQSARHQVFKPEKMWVYKRTCQCKPLAFVEDIYAERKRIGKNGPGIVLKLGLNSMFGKSVQSIGRPRYSNPIWGSFITAYPRKMLQDFVHSSPRCNGEKMSCGTDIAMMATDSVATITKRDDVRISDALGDWSCEEHLRGMLLVQPGVYFGSSGKPAKTRGVPSDFMVSYEERFRETFDTLIETHDINEAFVRVPQTLFVGMRYAIHRKNTKILGQWIEFGEGDDKGKKISFDWTTKRAQFPALAPMRERTWIQTYAYVGDTGIVTVPYSKNIGALETRSELRLAFDDQPDWGSMIDWEDN